MLALVSCWEGAVLHLPLNQYRLTNLTLFTAFCKFLGDGQLVEHVIETLLLSKNPNPRTAERIRWRSRRLARGRADVEGESEKRTGWTARQTSHCE